MLRLAAFATMLTALVLVAPMSFPAARAAPGANGTVPRRATLATFAQNWSGHDRGLVIRVNGRGFEQINSGCCPPSFIMHFQLSRPRGTTRVAFATLTVTAVQSPNPKRSPGPEPPPHIGETATITLKHDVLTDPLTDARYCGLHAPHVCGA